MPSIKTPAEMVKELRERDAYSHGQSPLLRAAADRIEGMEKALRVIRELTGGPSFRMGDRICAVIDSALPPLNKPEGK